MECSWLKIIWIYLLLVAGLSRIDLAVAGDGAYAVRACSYEIRAKSNELPSERLPEGRNVDNAHLETRGLGFDTSVWYAAGDVDERGAARYIAAEKASECLREVWSHAPSPLTAFGPDECRWHTAYLRTDPIEDSSDVATVEWYLINDLKLESKKFLCQRALEAGLSQVTDYRVYAFSLGAGSSVRRECRLNLNQNDEEPRYSRYMTLGQGRVWNCRKQRENRWSRWYNKSKGEMSRYIARHCALYKNNPESQIDQYQINSRTGLIRVRFQCL